MKKKQITEEVLRKYLKACDVGDVPDYAQAIFAYMVMDGYVVLDEKTKRSN